MLGPPLRRGPSHTQPSRSCAQHPPHASSRILRAQQPTQAKRIHAAHNTPHRGARRPDCTSHAAAAQRDSGPVRQRPMAAAAHTAGLPQPACARGRRRTGAALPLRGRGGGGSGATPTVKDTTTARLTSAKRTRTKAMTAVDSTVMDTMAAAAMDTMVAAVDSRGMAVTTTTWRRCRPQKTQPAVRGTQGRGRQQ